MGILDFFKRREVEAEKNGAEAEGKKVESAEGQKTVGEIVSQFILKNKAELKKTEMSGLVVIDLIRGIVNSNFSEDKIRDGLQHPNPKIRQLIEGFIREFVK